MKRIIILTCIAVFTTFAGYSQKYAFVDTEYILDNIPDYQEAQKKLDAVSVDWQRQIESKYAEIDRLYKSYQSEQVLLSADMKTKKENEIIAKEKEAKDFQKSKFGVDGALFKKRQELVKPIQDMVYNAIKQIAETGSYAVIFDKANSNILYTNARYDKSDDVLKKLGYKAGSK